MPYYSRTAGTSLWSLIGSTLRTFSLLVVVRTRRSLPFGPKAIFEMTSPVKSMYHLRLKLRVSQTVIMFAFELIFAK